MIMQQNYKSTLNAITLSYMENLKNMHKQNYISFVGMVSFAVELKTMLSDCLVCIFLLHDKLICMILDVVSDMLIWARFFHRNIQRVFKKHRNWRHDRNER